MKLDHLKTTGKACNGCFAALCCHSDFVVTAGEVERVRDGLTEHTRHLLQHALTDRHVEHATTNVTCPFLVPLKFEGHSCAIYADRPAACRVHGSDFPAPRCMEATPRNLETFRHNRDRLWRFVCAQPVSSWFEALQALARRL